MPITSISELPQEFAGLPEEGKRLAVSLVNKFEQQGLIGAGAQQQVLGILRQLYNQGADGTWTPKNPNAAGQTAEGQEKVAIGLFMPMMAASIIAPMVGGKAGSIIGKGTGIVGGLAGIYSGVKETYNAFKDNLKNVNPTVNVGAAPMNNMQVTASAKTADYDRLMQKISFVRNFILDAASKEIPIQFSKYQNGEKTASVVLGTTKDLFGMFPKFTDLVKTAAGGIVPITLERLIDKAVPIAAASGLIIGGKEIYDALRRHRSYKGMFQDYPELQEADPKRVERLYRLIQNYSPGLAKDSLGSGALIKNMLNYPDVIDISTIQGLINMEKGLNETSASTPFIRQMMSSAAGNMVSPSEAEKLEDRLKLIHNSPELLLNADQSLTSKRIREQTI